MTPDAILFVTCGGTIDKVYFDAKSEFEVGPPQVAGLLEEANVTLPHRILPVLRKDSLEMTDADREAIRAVIASQPERRVVLTHGTDTMVQTALALRPLADRTIVLTGSMQPARFRVSDAEFNLGAAVAAVQTLPSGIWIAMNGRVFPADSVRKNAAANRFEEVPPPEAADEAKTC